MMMDGAGAPVRSICIFEDYMIHPIQGLAHTPKSSVVRKAWAPVVCLISLSAALTYSAVQPQVLEAESEAANSDLDVDGLSFEQEYILGTDDSVADTDSDGYSDLEEIARGSDPLVKNSTPGPQPFATSTFAYSSGGLLYFQAAIYVKDSNTAGLSLESGWVNKNGQDFVFGKDVTKLATFYTKSATDLNDLLIVMNLPIPESIISKMGQMNLFVRLQDTAVVNPQPGSASTMSIVDSAGTMLHVRSSPASVNEGDGVIYRPLTGPNDSTPPTSTSGQVCWQSTFPVASSGNLIQFDILSASCQDFDAFCDPVACSASTGDSVVLVDPGTLLGG